MVSLKTSGNERIFGRYIGIWVTFVSRMWKNLMNVTRLQSHRSSISRPTPKPVASCIILGGVWNYPSRPPLTARSLAWGKHHGGEAVDRGLRRRLDSGTGCGGSSMGLG